MKIAVSEKYVMQIAAHKFNLAVSESLALKLFPVVRCTWAEQTDESLLDVSLTN